MGIELGGVATLKGRILDQTLEYSIPFQIQKPSGEGEGSFKMPIVHHLAAKSLIQDWQNGEGLQGLSADKQKKEIVDLSIEASVVSAHTAYIAVDEEQEKPIEGAIKTWDVTAAMVQQESYSFPMAHHSLAFGFAPIQAAPAFGFTAPPPPPSGGGLFGGPPPVMPMYNSSQSSSSIFGVPQLQLAGPPPPPSGGGLFGGPPPPPAPSLRSSSLNSSSFGFGGGTLGSAAQPVSSSSTRLIMLQAAEGFWRLDSTLASVFSKSPSELESACPMKLEGESLRTIWATVLTLVYLETQCQGDQDEWELVAMKAEMWLQGQTLPDGATIGTLREAAEKYWKN